MSISDWHYRSILNVWCVPWIPITWHTFEWHHKYHFAPPWMKLPPPRQTNFACPPHPVYPTNHYARFTHPFYLFLFRFKILICLLAFWGEGAHLDCTRKILDTQFLLWWIYMQREKNWFSAWIKDLLVACERKCFALFPPFTWNLGWNFTNQKILSAPCERCLKIHQITTTTTKILL